MASFETLRQLELHPEWLPPRSDVRVFLGEPGAPEATKTTVEPGNAFSPGMFTFGVTWWLRFPTSEKFFTPETAPLAQLRWSYAEGYLPAILCQVDLEDVRVVHTLFQDGVSSQFSEAVAARIELEASGEQPVDVQLFVALRSLGPAGGPLPISSTIAMAAAFGKGIGAGPCWRRTTAHLGPAAGSATHLPWPARGMCRLRSKSSTRLVGVLGCCVTTCTSRLAHPGPLRSTARSGCAARSQTS